MIDRDAHAAARLYAIDLLNRAGRGDGAGASYHAQNIALIAAIIPLIEADVIAAIEQPISGGLFATAHAILGSRISAGCHRPNSETPGSLTSRPGQPAAAPALSGAAGGGLSGE